MSLFLTLAPDEDAVDDPNRPAGGIAIVQSASGTTALGNLGLTVNFGVPVTAGNSVIALISLDDSGDGGFDQAPIQVGGGDTVLDLEVQEGGATATRVGIFSNHNVSSGITGIALDTAQAVRASMQILEVNGLADAVAEGTNAASGTSDEVTIDGLIPTSPNNLVVAMSAFVGNEYAAGPGGGFTRIGTGTGGGSVYQEAAYLIQSAATNTGTTWNLSNSVAYAAAGAAFGGA